MRMSMKKHNKLSCFLDFECCILSVGGDNGGYEQNSGSRELGRFDNNGSAKGLSRVEQVGQLQQKESNTPHTKRIHRSGVSVEITRRKRYTENTIFAIYSIEDSSGQTLLYESKGKQAKVELEELNNILEKMNYGYGNVDGTRIINSVFSCYRLSKGSGMAHSNGTVGRKSGNGNARVLRQQSRCNPSRAFRNVIENLFEIQDRADRGVKLSISTLNKLQNIFCENLENRK